MHSEIGWGLCSVFFDFLLSAEDIIVMVCEYVIYVYTSGDVKACWVFTRGISHDFFQNDAISSLDIPGSSLTKTMKKGYLGQKILGCFAPLCPTILAHLSPGPSTTGR